MPVLANAICIGRLVNELSKPPDHSKGGDDCRDYRDEAGIHSMLLFSKEGPAQI